MPRRTRAAAVQEEEERENDLHERVEDNAQEVEYDEEEAYGEEGTRALQFNQPLTWRAGKPIAVGELLKRLQALSTELRTISQEEAERETLLPVAKELATHNLLSHKDKGVKSWTAACIVDMFRLCAPEAPFTQSQMKEIFNLIVNIILPALSDPSNPYTSQNLYVAQQLAEVKSIILIADLPNANTMILQLFTNCFDALSGPSKAESGEEMSKNVEYYFTSLLATVIDESDSLPKDIVDIILAQFLRADPRITTSQGTKQKKQERADEKQSTLLLKHAPPAYNMAQHICNASADKMGRHVSQYFSSIIVDSSSGSFRSTKHKSGRGSSPAEESDDDQRRGPSEEDLKEIQKAHKLLRELWRSCPDVLANVIPQVEAELAADNADLRLLATETLGDMVSGIGAAGPPLPPSLNPSAYPSQSIMPSSAPLTYNFLTTPNSPHDFITVHSSAYRAFAGRIRDKSAVVRAACATGIGRILATSAGGVGIDLAEEETLLKDFANAFVDGDEKVRLAAVQAITAFEFRDIVQRLGSTGGMDDEGSILHGLIERIKDRKLNVRAESMELVAKLWGVAVGAIAAGEEQIASLLGPIPSKILETIYLDDPEVNALVTRVFYESLVPLNYPPVKAKAHGNGDSQRVKDSQQQNGDQDLVEPDTDKIRAERILLLLRDLGERARKAFYFLQNTRILKTTPTVEAFLKRCEEYNGGVADKKSAVKEQLAKVIDALATKQPEPLRISDDLWKFAKAHDRRSYQLIRFCYDPDSDYKKVSNAFRELKKRVREASSSTSTLLDTIEMLAYRVSLFVYNRSHVPAIMEFARTNHANLSATAHELLKEISTRSPQILSAQIKEICQSLELEAPTEKRPNQPGAVDDLKACVGFARQFPKEIPKQRNFLQALVSYATHGTPPRTAKHAVSILMAVATDKKQLYARKILEASLHGFEYGKDNYLTKLAALSQLMLLGPTESLEEDIDSVTSIAVEEIILKTRVTAAEGDMAWEDEPDEHCAAKLWALKLLVNQLRAHSEEQPAEDIAKPVLNLLNGLISNKGEVTSGKDTPPAHKARLRLAAAQFVMKLCTEKRYDSLLTARDFNRFALLAYDPEPRVRQGFVSKLKKHLALGKLPHRFYTPLFLLAYEPKPEISEPTKSWLRSRATYFAKSNDTVMEALLGRLISLLAHHPDFPEDPNDLLENVPYIAFYLTAIATEQNISLIYHVAQRVKSVSDGIDPSKSENLYKLSDLFQEFIRRYAEAQGWSLPTYPAKLRLPTGLFAQLTSHDVAQRIATKKFIPEEVEEQLDEEVRKSIRSRKRKLAGTSDSKVKKRKTTDSAKGTKPKALPVRRGRLPHTPKAKKQKDGGDAHPSSDIRRSTRNAGSKSYVEVSSDEDNDDEEMEDADAVDAQVDEQEDTEEQSDSDRSEQQPSNRRKSARKK